MKRFTRALKTSLLLSVLVATSAYAGGGGASNGGGGGDPDGLEFAAIVKTMLANIDASAALRSKISTTGLRVMFANTHVVVVTRPLYATVSGLQQESVALNFPDKNLIEINRFRWEQIGNPILKEGIALHELESLARVEQTGAYKLSSDYVEAQGARPDDLLKAAHRSLVSRLTGSGILKVPLTTKFLNAQSSGLSLRLCRYRETDGSCELVLKDLNGQTLKANQDLVVRPGRYLLELFNDPDFFHPDKVMGVNPIYFEIENRETYAVKLTEVFASTREQGRFSFEALLNLDDESELLETLRTDSERRSSGLGQRTFSVPAGYKPDYVAFEAEDGMSILRWHLCEKAISNPEADPQTVLNCRVLLSTRRLDSTLQAKIEHTYKVSSTELNFSMLQIHVPSFVNGDQLGILSGELKQYLAANPNSVPVRLSPSSDDCLTVRELRMTAPALVAHGRLTRESAFVLTSGSYIVRWKNESGDSEERALGIGSQLAIEISP